MGSGKTTAIINEALKFKEKDESSNERLLILTFYLDEIERITEETGFSTPPEGSYKRGVIKSMFVNGDNICCSHALFNLFDEETFSIIRDGEFKYYLIIDESPQMMSNIVGKYRVINKESQLIERFSNDDYKIIQKDKLINISEDGQITWNDDNSYKSGVFDEIKRYLITYDLYSYNDNETIVALVKPSVFNVFQSVIICGYLLKGSIFDNWLSFYKSESEYFHVENNSFAEGYRFEYPFGLDRMFICFKERYNFDKRLRLTKRWFQMTKKEIMDMEIKKMAKAVRGFTRTFAKNISAELFYWTTFDTHKDIMKGKCNSLERFLPCNKKATNDFMECQACSYLANRYPNMNIVNFLSSKGIKVNKELYALSELIQFIYRSNLRVKDSIKTVYVHVPVKRMRDLLCNFIEGYKKNIGFKCDNMIFGQ